LRTAKWATEELEELDEIVSNDWCWAWPGWKWVANTLNGRCGHRRTASQCRYQYIKLSNAQVAKYKKGKT